MIGRSAQPGAMLFRVVIGRWTKLPKIVKNVVAMTSAFHKLEKSAADEFDIQLFDVWFFKCQKRDRQAEETSRGARAHRISCTRKIPTLLST